MMEAVLVLAAALQWYVIKPADGTYFPTPRPILTLRPDSVVVDLVPR